MAKQKKAKAKPAGEALPGKITNRIASGEISKASVFRKTPRQTAPKVSAVLRAIGRGLGSGAERRRNGGSGGANDDQ